MIAAKTRSRLVAWIVTASLVPCAGCGGTADQGPPRFDVSGQVTFEGEAVPHGFIMFTPDASQGNRGPATGAPIEDGNYATESGKGTVGGPHIVKITGYDGVPIVEEGEELSDGTELFPVYETPVELPKESKTVDFDVPPPE